MCTYKMEKKLKFCIDTRHFECTVYWFDIEYVIKHIKSINFNTNLTRQFTLMDVPTINKDHLVMNISERFYVLIN